MKKAQSAMEYLMTYGWAILIVIIVAAALYALGVFNPQTYTSQQSSGFADVDVPEYQFDGTTDQLSVRVENNKLGGTITVNNISANCGSAGADVESTQTAGGTVDIALSGTSTFTFACAGLNANDNYNFDVTVNFIKAGNTFPQSNFGSVTGAAV